MLKNAPVVLNSIVLSTAKTVKRCGLSPSTLPGFPYEKDPRLYFDDTCVVPERLEGEVPV